MRIWHTHQKGLTLLELLVTVAVIAVIAVIAIPTVGNILPATQDRTVQEAQNTVDDFISKWNDSGAYTFDPTSATWTGYIDLNGDGVATSDEAVEEIDLNEEQYIIDRSHGDAPTDHTGIDYGVIPEDVFTIGGATSNLSGVQPLYDPIIFTYLNTSFTKGSNNHQLSPTVSGGSENKTYSVTGNLPDGVTFDEATGTFTGPADSAWNFTATQVSVGPYHTCAVTTAGGAKCWGGNSGIRQGGQLGDGTTTYSSTPVDVLAEGESAGGAPLTGVTSISVGSGHTCAVVDGGAKCWGYNGDGGQSDGQLGDGTTTNSSTPVDVVGLTSGVDSISAGLYHTCAVVDGGAKCWGRNYNGQLGDGTTTERTTPVTVVAEGESAGGAPLTGITSISAGHDQTCAVVDGGAKCWGGNGRGRLGDGTTTNSSTPVDVLATDQPVGGNPLTGITSISAGGGHTCAVVDGGAKCWGWNGDGQLGDGTTTERTTPVDVLAEGESAGGAPLTAVTDISAGGGLTCAVVDGGAKCWGNNDYGKLGDGNTQTVDACEYSDGFPHIETNPLWCTAYGGTLTTTIAGPGSTTPVDVSGLTSGVESISAYRHHACALTVSGGAKCWGGNWRGELGDGTTDPSSTPVDVLFGSNFGAQPGFPATVDVTVSDESGTETRTVTLSVD